MPGASARCRHRVRLATHSAYRDFVQGFGLEFYPLGGDPKLLSQYIVKHRARLSFWTTLAAETQCHAGEAAGTRGAGECFSSFSRRCMRSLS